MPDHPPPHLAEPASPLLLDQDLPQATAEAHTYVRHIERYSALAARAAERVRDDACFCIRLMQSGPSPCAILSGCATVAATHPRSQPVLCARPQGKGRVCCREREYAIKLSAAVQARKVWLRAQLLVKSPDLKRLPVLQSKRAASGADGTRPAWRCGVGQHGGGAV